MSVEFLIGADPELFVRDRDNNLVSAFGMIPGTKDCPHEVEGGAVQVDGMALEFNINPANNFKDFNKNIVGVLKQLKEMIPEGYSFDFSPVAEFGKDYISKQPEMARELGCNPDFNAHRHGPNEKPDGDYPFRTASGHIHIGWTAGQDIDVPEHIEACKMAVSQLDVTVGLAARKWDRDQKRSTMYGKFGCYRPKPYGVEYRTLSNTWVDDVERRNVVFNTAMEAMEKLLSGKRLYEKYYIPDFDIYVQQNMWRDLDYYANSTMRGFKSYKTWYSMGKTSSPSSLQKIAWDAILPPGIPIPQAYAAGNAAPAMVVDFEVDAQAFDEDI